MERNQAASNALHECYDKASITEIDDFSEALWLAIASTPEESFSLELINNDDISLEFIVKLLVKIGFSCEDAVRLMMQLHKNGRIVLASADETTLLSLQHYINIQASARPFRLTTKIIKA